MYRDTFVVVALIALGAYSTLGFVERDFLEDYLQPLDVGIRNRTYDNFIDDDKLCSRDCTKYPEPRTCYYKFVAEQYHAMGPACKNCPMTREDCFSPQCVQADGIERTVLTFNRLLDGPSLHVCYGDRIIVDVHNKMPAREVSVHWHGELQPKSPWMDGVPHVTQCPIDGNTWFRYDFIAATPGSHFYHSHSGLQLFDGLSGCLIVRTSKEVDPLRNQYDYDLFSHTIQIQDWLHVLMDDKFPGYNKNKTMITVKPDSYLINGMGGYQNPVTLQWTGTPFAEFFVKPNKKYRFRIVSTSSTTCSFQFTIEGHAMTLIATDGYPNPFAINPENEYPLIKDTLPVPPAGFAVARFVADNPGFWVLHCHFQNHNMAGMVVIIQVGEPNEMIPVPEGWPKCGNYLPPVRIN